MRKKSIVLAVILGTFFGPLGLIYSTVTGAVVLIPLAIILGVLTPFALGALLVLPVSFVWAIVGTVRHNRFVEPRCCTIPITSRISGFVCDYY